MFCCKNPIRDAPVSLCTAGTAFVEAVEVVEVVEKGVPQRRGTCGCKKRSSDRQGIDGNVGTSFAVLVVVTASSIVQMNILSKKMSFYVERVPALAPDCLFSIDFKDSLPIPTHCTLCSLLDSAHVF